jgi:hypothetical protein
MKRFLAYVKYDGDANLGSGRGFTLALGLLVPFRQRFD